MSASVKATIDNRDEIVYLNLDLAVRIERPRTRGYTIIQFISGAGSQTVKETPEELLRFRPKRAHAQWIAAKQYTYNLTGHCHDAFIFSYKRKYRQGVSYGGHLADHAVWNCVCSVQ